MEEPRRLGGRYELGSALGRGGMAEVYLAHDTRLGRTVAVKTLRADLARDPTFQARFRREAQSAASLNHPAIVAVYDTGEDYVDGVSIPYIVMEYVDGSTLRELLHSGRKLLPERALEMCVGILQALEYSHRSGIVHRDIKPANVMLTRTGQVKVMDFGIARAMGDSGMTMTQTAAVIGTAQYLSPEQAKGENVDARSDLYSTGCLLYELLTLRPPFVGDSPVAVAYQHVREEPQPPSVFDSEVTPAMDAIVLKALTKDPDYRYQSADEMRADIEAALEGRPIAAAPAVGGAGYGPSYPDDQPTTALRRQQAPTSMLPPVREDDGGFGYDEPDERPGRRRQERPRSRASTILLAIAGVLVLVGAIFVGKALWDGAPTSTIEVPQMAGKTFEEAQTLARNGGFRVERAGSEHCDQEKNTVCSTTPEAGTKIERDSVVKLTMSKGPAPVEVPDVTNQPFDQARQQLEQEGFKVKRENVESEQEPGTVVGQSPDGGSEAPRNSVVTLQVATPPKIEVPNVVGRTYEQAKQQLESLGFTVARQDDPDSDQPRDTVTAQDPAANSKVEANSRVVLTVSTAEPEEEKAVVPEGLAGKELQEVKAALEQAGFSVQVQGPQEPNARVLTTNPGSGHEGKKGDTVTVITAPPGTPGGVIGGPRH